MRYLSILLLLTVLGAQPCSSQNPQVKNYKVEHGLPSNETYDVLQDSKGFIWIATDNGVVRFDGLTFKTFKIKEGLADPVVFGITEDKQGRIWFRTFSGKLFFYANGKIESWRMNTEITSLVKNELVTSLVIDSLNQFWLVTHHGKLLKADSTTISVADSTTEIIVVKNINGQMISLSGYRNRIRFDQQEYIVKVDSIHSGVPIVKTWNKKNYISVYNSLFEIDRNSCREVLKTPTRIISLSLGNENQLWVGYVNGVQVFEKNLFEKSLKHPIPNEASVTSVLDDHEGGLWITTLEKGVYFIPQNKISNYQIESKFRIKTHRGILVKTYADKFIEIDTLGNISSVVIPEAAGQLYGPIFQDRHTNFWLDAGVEGLNILNKEFRFIKKFNKHGGNAISMLEEGEKVYTLTPYALITFNKYEFEKTSQFRRDYYRSFIKVDSLFFIAGRLGLSVFNDNFEEKKKLTLFDNIKIASLMQVNDSIIAIGTLGYGLYLYNKRTNSAIQFKSNQKFLADNIYSIFSSDSVIWLGTERGVVMAKLKSLLTGSPEVKWITSNNGLISDKINYLTKINSTIWAFSDDGVSQIPLKVFLSEKKLIQFDIWEILINGVSAPYETFLSLPYNKNNIKIKFGFVSLQNQDIFIRYKLNEDDPWQYTTERLFEFSSLAPGNYQLILQYSVDSFSWTSVNESDSVSLSITPPWWKTIWFQAFIVSFASLLIFLFLRNREKRLNRHQQQILRSEIDASERERVRIAQELHDRVGTDLSAMKMIVGQLLQKNGNGQSERVENNFQDMIREIKDIIYNLSPPGLERFGLFQTVKHYIEKLQPIQTYIKFNTFGQDVVDPELGIAVFRVLQELISNSLKHASAENITIHISSFPDLVNIVYEDNGKGFSPDSAKTGMGLQNIKTRIRSFGGQITFESGTFGVSYSIDIPLTTLKT